MNNKNIIGEFDSFWKKSVADLKEMLDNELANPDDKTDYGLVDELTTVIIKVEGREYLIVNIDKKLNEFNDRIKKRGRIIKFQKWAVYLSAVCVILLYANLVSNSQSVDNTSSSI